MLIAMKPLMTTKLLAVEPTYDDDDYVYTDYTDPIFDDYHNMWSDGGPMPHEKIDLESAYFTGSNFSRNHLSCNPNARIVYQNVARERARRPTSNTPSNLSPNSLQVAVKRVSLLLNKTEDYTQMVVDTFGRIEINSCHVLCVSLVNTQDNRALAPAFKRRFEETSRGLILCHKQLSFFRCSSMYMDGR